MATLIINGFKDAKQAADWWSWYEGQGEQDATMAEWVGADILADVIKGVEVDEETVKVSINYYED